MIFKKHLEIREHAAAVFALAWDGTFLYSGSADKHVTRWDITTGQQDNFAIKFEQSVYSLEIVDNFLIVGLSDGAIHVFDLIERKEIKHFTQHRKAIFSIRHNDLLKQIYIGDADGNLSIWNSETFDQIIYLPLDCGKIRDIKINKDGTLFALACQDSTVRLFESKRFNEIVTLEAHEGGANSILFHPTKTETIISGGKDARIKVWDFGSQECKKNVPAHNFAVYGLVSIGSETLVSISRDKTIKIWDLDLNILKRIESKDKGHTHSVNDIVQIGDTSFVTGSDDRRIIYWTKD